MSFDKDDFWDIEKLLPKKKKTVAPFSTKEKTVDFTVPGEPGVQPTEDTKISCILEPREQENKAVYSFGGGFMRSVTITRFVDKYDFYGNFRKAALVYYEFKTSKCDFVPFYSYMPQYSQFNVQQKNFYFYWRDCVRRKKYIKTDYSYFYLYVYEILNLPDKISASEGLALLTEIWRAYRGELPNIDANMSLWIQDYCLVYNLPCPMEDIKDFIFDVIGAAEFKEFYLSDVQTVGLDGISAMIAYLSDYDWRRGKYAGGDNREIYAKHLIGAMGLLIRDLWQSGKIISSTNEHAKITRNAFRNCLCTHSVKCRLDIEYIPFSKSESLRHSVTSALKYTENKLRGLLGVKSRLAVKDLPDEYRKIIDLYFNEIYAKVNRERELASRPEYEKLYESDNTEMSFIGAEEIERSSWSTTARLVSEETEEEDELVPAFVANHEDTETAAYENIAYGLSIYEIEFINAVQNENLTKIKELSQKAGVMPDAVVERINETFADGFGDVIITGENPCYSIIEDYKEDIKEWLMKVMK